MPFLCYNVFMISENVKLYCYEDPSLIENYAEAVADTKMWHCHHRVETIMHCGAKELIAKDCYENRPAHDLIFLTKSEHNKLHKAGENGQNFGRRHSDSAKKKMSEHNAMHREEYRKKVSEALHRPEAQEKLRSRTGSKHPRFGKKHSEESRNRISINTKKAMKGNCYWFNNGIVNKRCASCPAGFVKGRLLYKKS